GKLARMRPVSEMSFSFIFTPAVPTKASTIGRRENVESAGASSTFVQTISRSDMLAPPRAAFATLHTEFVIFQLNVEIRPDQLVLDKAPHDARHFAAVEFAEGFAPL